MTITLNGPSEVEKTLREAWGDRLDRAVLEALAIEGYRSRRFGIGAVRQMLGFESRWETEQWLGGQGVSWNYTLEDLEDDRKTLDEVLGPVKP
jgi:Uncharacterised protein family (UPF0175)